MNLVKWFRKNNKKIMAVVVIVLMIGFVGGTYISQLGQRRRTWLHNTAAHFGDNEEITEKDRVLSLRELEVLKMLRADDMLRSVGFLLFGRTQQDLQALLLGELLFSERRISPRLIEHIKQMIRANGYRVSDKQINDIYRHSMARDIYWLLLKNEAEQSGIRISNKDSGNLLGRTIPRLFDGAAYSQLIGSLINRLGIPEKDILTTYGKLLAVLEYARMVCSSEAITNSQIMHNVSWEEERIDVEFVKFDSSVFAENQDEPSEERIIEHFDKYKKFFSGSVSEGDPYGFGYKLADRVQLEYIAVNLDDISGIVTTPTQEEAEEYYIKYREQFTEQVPSAPNDPNSLLTERIKSYAEMASEISKHLLQEKINSKAEMILQEAKTLTEVGLQDIDMESANLSSEEFSQMVGDYETTAEELTEKHKISVYTGQTGLLSAADIQADEYLGRQYLERYGYNLVRLTRIVFAVDELEVSELGPFDVPKPRIYENIGLVKDPFGEIMAVVRVIEAEKASEPESINQTFSKGTLRFEQTPEQAGEDVYSVKEEVAEDLKRLAAMDTTKNKAEEFIGLAVEEGWESAVEKFNELYGQQDKQDEGVPNDEDALSVFELQNFANLPRISRETIGTLAVQSVGSPAAQFSVDLAKKESLLRNRFYSLVPQDSNTIDTVPIIMEFKPDMSYYVIKNISVKRIEQEQYEKVKALQSYRESVIQSQSLAAVHFNPENISKRMNFRWVKQSETTTDPNTPAVSEGAS